MGNKGNKILGAWSFIWAFAFLSPLKASPIALSGTVRDIHGQGIADARVSLKLAALSTRTDSLGRFTFDGSARIRGPGFESFRPIEPAWGPAGLAFGITATQNVSAQIFDLRGQSMARPLHGILAPGNYLWSVPAPGLVSLSLFGMQPLFLVLRLGERKTVLRIPFSALRTGGGTGLRRLPPDTDASQALSKVSGSSSDTLTVNANGFSSATRVIAAFPDTADFILENALKMNFGTDTSAFGRFAVGDFIRLANAMFINEADTANRYPSYDIVAGTVAGNPLIADKVRSGAIVLPVGKFADQGYALKTIGSTIYVAAASTSGLANGLYDLLERYGAYFQMSTGKVLPARTRFAVAPMDTSAAPVFKYRGIFPWDNFLDGMSGWSEEDYRDFIDKMARMKFNLIQFHFYPDFAFYNEAYAGQDTVKPGWVANPTPDLKTAGLIGATAFGGAQTIGPKEWIDNKGDPLKQASACQAMLRRVIDYAHSRGIMVSLGFALMEPRGANSSWVMTSKGTESIPLPISAANVGLEVERYRRLVSIYPNADVYWLWQSEAGGNRFKAVGPEAGYAAMRQQYAHWSTVPGSEGDIDYCYLFRELANRLTPTERKKLSTGGWDIEHAFPGLDGDIDPNIIFASLNNAYPAVSKPLMDNYKVARNGRRSWMIDWAEFDGNAWFPQFRVADQNTMYDKCRLYGVEAVTLLTWKQTGLDQAFRYLTDYAWHPGLTKDQFYASFCAKLYGKSAGPSLVPMYDEYESIQFKQPRATFGDDRNCNLGDGWTSLGLPGSLPGIAGTGDAEWRGYVDNAATYKTEQAGLKATNQKWVSTLASLSAKMDASQKAWADILANRLSMQNLYLDAMGRINSSFEIFDRNLKLGNLPEAQAQSGASLQSGLDLIQSSIEKYAEVILNKSDMGLVGQMNVQAYDVVKEFQRKAMGHSSFVTVDWTAFRLLGTSKLNQDFFAAPWPVRDGNPFGSTLATVDGSPTQHLSLGGADSKFNSFWVYRDVLDVEKYPYLDFQIRWVSKDPKDAAAFLFQLDTDPGTWYKLDLIGSADYALADALPAGALEDGQWHRVTWNLKKLVFDWMGKPGSKMTQVILGNWNVPKAQPAVVEIRGMAIGNSDTSF